MTGFCSAMGVPPKYFCIGRINDCAYLRGPLRPEDWLNLHVLMPTSAGTPFIKAVEQINYAPHPVVEDVACLPGLVLAEALMYDRALPEAAEACFAPCLACLGSYLELRLAPSRRVANRSAACWAASARSRSCRRAIRAITRRT